MMGKCATTEGTSRFAFNATDSKGIVQDHFRNFSGLTLTSIGMGTYLGDLDSRTDNLVESAVRLSLASGAINVIDTAINYRYQKAERCVGRAIRSLIADRSILREQIFISTKNGYLAPDAEYEGGYENYVSDEFISKGVVSPKDIVGSSHCMTEKYLSHELERSLSNLQLECIDLLYLHNSAESQIPEVGRHEYKRRLCQAFLFFESACREGKIASYGLATWDCFRNEPASRDHLDLEEVADIANDVGGRQNGFKFIQFPFNLAMPEALILKNQRLDRENVSLLEACIRLEIGAFTSVPFMQSRLIGHPELPKIGSLTSAQVNLQFARSSLGVIAPLVGQKRPEHVAENVSLAKVSPLTPEQLQHQFFN